jgi:hypothetical protein
MTRKLLLVALLSISSWYTCQAQDPSVGGFLVNPNPLATNANGTVGLSFGNGSSTAIPQASNATYTINLPPNIGVVSASISPAAPNISISIGTYDPVIGTIVNLVSNQGPVPGNASYIVTLNVKGVQPTNGTPAPISANASSNPTLGSNNPNNDNASSSISVTGPLPVALVSFTARAQENRTVALTWVTSLETNNKGFLIERSKDLAHFEKVADVNEVAPMSNALKTYHLTDQMPFAGTSYYRLTQTDLSGKATAYPVVSVILRDAAYGVFPNPVVSEQRFALGLDEPETATVNFFSADGRPLSLQKMGIESGNLMLKSVDKLPAGVYVLTVQERGLTRKHRLVIQ